MQSQYTDADAAAAIASRAEGVSEDLALRTYTARLLGREGGLVLHGGGNTSVKSRARDAIGRETEVLHVKGSGWDLATIEAPGHPAVRLARLRELADVPSLTDEQMVNELRLALLDASAPTPSVEALLHAVLPAKWVDHTHADAVLSVLDQPEPRALAEEVWGADMLYVPYVMPGFGLARACKVAWEEAAAVGLEPKLMILERHGIFTFGETAKESYERMIDAVTRAERFTADRMQTANVPAVDRDEVLEARVAPILRGALAEVADEPMERGPVVVVRSHEWILAFLERKDLAELTGEGCATPDHVIRTKPWPMVVSEPAYDDDARLRAQLLAGLRSYRERYEAYFRQQSEAKGVVKKQLDPWPRVVLLPRVGVCAVGRTVKEATIAADIYEHTVQVIVDACDVGDYKPVGRGDLFEVEYWSLEQAKLKKPVELPLSGRVSLVTGAASGIGLATARCLAEAGAHVVLVDRDAGLLGDAHKELSAAFGASVAMVLADVSRPTEVELAMSFACRTFGGLDVVVSNAGTAPQGLLHTPAGDDALRGSLEGNLVAHNVVASAAVEIMRTQGRGGCLLFNASKAAFAPGPNFGPYAVAKAGLVALMRQYAIDLGPEGIRANAVNADRVRTRLFDDGVAESRASARGLTVAQYFASNLLSREVEARDVGAAFVHLAAARATTGCVLTVDGGNPAAFPR
ncbi:MAG: bifunctional aldolase/short-chain dehydrogenase [Polyangiaceae bacterium]